MYMYRSVHVALILSKARRRLEESADRMAKQHLGIATDAESEAVRLAAIRDALDRAGLVTPRTLDVAEHVPTARW